LQICSQDILGVHSHCLGTHAHSLIQIDLGPIPEHYFHMRFPTWSSLFTMHVKAWDQHQYQQLGMRFHGYLLFFCRKTSGDLVEPMSLWSASECFMSPSRRLMQVLVGDIHWRVFFWSVSRIKCKTYNHVPRTGRREASAGCVMKWWQGLRFGSRYNMLSQRQRIFHVRAHNPWIIYAGGHSFAICIHFI
jgi:hypothetical protein